MVLPISSSGSLAAFSSPQMGEELASTNQQSLEASPPIEITSFRSSIDHLLFLNKYLQSLSGARVELVKPVQDELIREIQMIPSGAWIKDLEEKGELIEEQEKQLKEKDKKIAEQASAIASLQSNLSLLQSNLSYYRSNQGSLGSGGPTP